MTSDPSTHPAAPSPRKHFQKLFFTFLKIVVAIAGMCFVIFTFGLSPPPAGEWNAHVAGLFYIRPAFHWHDTALIPAGQQLRAAVFQEDVLVEVLQRAPVDPTQRQIVRIRFPATPVALQVEGREVRAVIADDTPLPEIHGQLAIPSELDIPLSMLSEIQNERIHEGLKTLLINASGKWYLLLGAWALLGIPFLVTAIRWRNLMRPQGIDMPLAKCIQLTFVGQFYSIMLPGITGGDLVKIVYAARLTGSKTKSFITIILDRVIGLVALMVIAGTSAGIQLLLNVERGAPQDNTLFNVFLMVLIMLAVLAAATTIYFSRRLRRVAGIEWFIENFGKLSTSVEGDTGQSAQHRRLEHLFRITNGAFLALALFMASSLALLRWQFGFPWAQKNTPTVYAGIGLMTLIALAAAAGLVFHTRLVDRMTPPMRKVVELIIRVDETLHVYRGHFGLLLWAFIISLISQLTLPLSAWLSGTAFGMSAPMTHYLAYVPLAVLAASLPVSPPQGFGVLDWIIFHFFVERGKARVGQAVALAQAIRFLPILWNLLGAFWVVTGRYSRHQAQEEQRALKE